jgi:hypothetical protein
MPPHRAAAYEHQQERLVCTECARHARSPTNADEFELFSAGEATELGAVAGDDNCVDCNELGGSASGSKEERA